MGTTNNEVVRWDDYDGIGVVARLVASTDPEAGPMLEECWEEVMRLEDIGLYSEAAYECREMIVISELPQVFRLVALEHVVCGERAQALIIAHRCVNIAPAEPDRHRALGDVQFELKRYARAVRAYQRAVDLGANDPDLLQSLGRCHALLGDQARAAEWHERALAADPGSEDVRLELGWYYHRLGRNEDAEALLEEALELETHSRCKGCRVKLAAAIKGAGSHAEAEALEERPASSGE